MNPSEPNPKLPTWLFIATDLALIGTAALIAYYSRPLTPTTMFLIVGCVAGGAIFGLVPLVARFERLKNEALDDRQRALEALARTVAASAEQISIAASGLHEIAELAQKNLRHAEQLPHKLQEKIAEFQAQLASADDTEKEELERELLALRTSESERLDAVSLRIAKSTAEWVKLEAAAHQHLAAANDAVAKVSATTVGAIARAQAAAEQALSHSRVEAARTVGDASVTATHAVEIARNSALADLDAKLTAASAAVVERVVAELSDKLTPATRALDEKIALLEAAVRRLEAPPPPVAVPLAVLAPAPAPTPAPVADDAIQPTPPAPAAEPTPPPAVETSPPPPKRPRKPRREEPTPTEPALVAEAKPDVTPEPIPESSPESASPIESAPPVAEPAAEIAAAEVAPIEPAPIPVEKIAEVAPVAPHTAEPFSGAAIPPALAPVEATAEPTAAQEPPAEPVVDPVAPPPAEAVAPPIVEAAITPVVEPEPPARKRPPVRKPEVEDEPALDLDLDDAATATSPGAAERVMSSDGASRLIVTAYIGIGNRLFIRGEGPGLSWEKGVPLQFVSIGKWRWETSDATGPIQFKIYKNDDLECTALGTPSMDPGQQLELSATF